MITFNKIRRLKFYEPTKMPKNSMRDIFFKISKACTAKSYQAIIFKFATPIVWDIYIIKMIFIKKSDAYFLPRKGQDYEEKRYDPMFGAMKCNVGHLVQTCKFYMF